MIVGDRVRIADGALALGAPQSARDVRGVCEGVSYEQEWDTFSLDQVKVHGRWYPAQMWEVDE